MKFPILFKIPSDFIPILNIYGNNDSHIFCRIRHLIQSNHRLPHHILPGRFRYDKGFKIFAMIKQLSGNPLPKFSRSPYIYARIFLRKRFHQCRIILFHIHLLINHFHPRQKFFVLVFRLDIAPPDDIFYFINIQIAA